MNRSSRLQEGALVGGLLGLVECFLAAATGQIQRMDLVWIWSFDLALGVGVGITALALGALLLRRAPGWIAPASIVAAPAVLLALRGPLNRSGDLTSLEAVVALPLIAAPFPVLRFVWTRHAGALPVGSFAAVACACLSVAIFSFSKDLVPNDGAWGRPVAALGLIAATSVLYRGLISRAARGSWGAPVLWRTVGLAGVLGAGGGQLLVQSAREAGVPMSSASPSRSTQAMPNVLLVTLDTVRRDHLSCYGSSRATSPALEELVRTATLYTNAYATSPYTLASHASLFTGLLPSAHGARPVPYTAGSEEGPSDVPLAPEHETLAEVLRKRGYESGAIVANYGHLSLATGLAQGFDSYDSRAERIHGHVPLLVSFLFRLGPALSPRAFLGWTKASREADAITEAAIAWIRRTRERPFFLFVNYLDAHAPYAPPPEHARRFSRGGGFLVQLKWNRNRELSEEDWAFLGDQYDASVAFVDHEIGRLVAFLKASGLFERTLIAVTSDHGEFLGERGLRGHGQALYEPVLRIPMIVKRPGQRVGGSEGQLTTLADLHWLIREALDERLAPPAPDTARVVAEYWTPWIEKRHHPSIVLAPAWRATYQGPLKLIETSSRPPQLFDLSNDRSELRDLFATPEGARQAQAMLSQLPALEERPRSGIPAADPDAQRRLRALGYIR